MGCFGQSRAIVDFEADVMRPVKIADSTVLSLVGSVVFHHNGAIITCDSAIRYSGRFIECYNNVIINKDSTYVYGDRADFNGLTNIAQVYSPLVKLIDKDVTMYSHDLEFNTLTNIGSYVQGGTISQKDNLMESIEATYHSKERDIYFSGDVVMRNDEYTIETDSMGYNFDTEITTFYKSAKIWNKAGDFLSADKGSYDRKYDTYVFTDNSYVLTKDQQMWADSITYMKTDEISYLYKDIQIHDEVQRLLSFGDYGVYWGQPQNAILTDNPSVIGYEERMGADSVIVYDSVYMRADSIFIYTFPIDSMVTDSALLSVAPDSLVVGAAEGELAAMDQEESAGRELTENEQVLPPDLPDTDPGLKPAEQRRTEEPKPKSKREIRREERLERRRAKMRAYEAVLKAESGDTVKVADTAVVVRDSLPAPVVRQDSVQKDSLQRIIRGFYNVKIFRNDFQAVCDSLVSYSIDSTAHMYRNPVLWSDSSQVVSDIVHIYSKNQQLYRAEFDGSPMMSQQVNDSLYNQVAGKLMDAYFRNNDIYKLDVNGNAQTYYYLQEDGSDNIGGFLVAESAEITFLFDSSRVDQIVYRGSPVYTIFPMEKIPVDQSQFLKGFEWKGEQRPKDKTEVCDRTVRPSRREEVMAIPKPEFMITEQINKEKERLIKDGVWRDRTETMSVDPSYFQHSQPAVPN